MGIFELPLTAVGRRLRVEALELLVEGDGGVPGRVDAVTPISRGARTPVR